MKLTYIAGISLDDISWNKENIDRVIKLSKELHSVPLNLQVPIYDKNILEKQFNNNCNFLGSHIKCDEIKKWMKYVECEKKILNERRYNNYIHRDFRSGNLLKTEDGRIGVIDFESCGIGDFLFDVIKLYLEIVNEDTSLAMYFLEKYLDIHGVENRHKALQIVRLYNIMDKVGMLVWLIKKQRKDDTYYMWNLEQIRETLM